MPEIKLHRRYPDSRPEDITDAYMRGMKVGIEIADSQHDHRIDASKRRIKRMQGRLDGIEKGIEAKLWDIEIRIEAMERKLNHKGGEA